MESEQSDAWRYILDVAGSRIELSKAHLISGDTLLKRRQWKEAGASYEQAARLCPDQAAAWSGCGVCHIRMGAPDKAEACFRYALALDSTCGPAMLGLCDLRRSQYRLEDALVWLLRAEANLGATHDIMLHRAQIALEMNHFDDAVKISEQLCKERPESSISWSVLGVSRGNNGDAQGALAAFGKAWRITPDDPEITLNYGFSLLQLGYFKDGWVYYDQRLNIPSTLHGGVRFKSTPVWQP